MLNISCLHSAQSNIAVFEAGGFPPDIELILHRLRDVILTAVPGADFAIKYTMPLFTSGDFYLYVAAWKKHIGLYPIFRAPAALERELKPLRHSKDTVKLLYSKPIPYELVARIVEAKFKGKA